MSRAHPLPSSLFRSISLSILFSLSLSIPFSPLPPRLFVLYLFLSFSLSLSHGGGAWLVTTRRPRARCGARRATICRVCAGRRAAARGESPSAGRAARARGAANHHPPAGALRDRHAGRAGAGRRAAASCASPPAGREPPSAESAPVVALRRAASHQPPAESERKRHLGVRPTKISLDILRYPEIS